MDGLMMDLPAHGAAVAGPGDVLLSRRGGGEPQAGSLARPLQLWRGATSCPPASLGALARLGVGRGDRVATLSWNNTRHLEAYFAVPLMGGCCTH